MKTAILSNQKGEVASYHLAHNYVFRIHPRTGFQTFPYKNASEARFQFTAALDKSAFTGWIPVYVGPPLRG